jgi:molybdenum cofactor biosynthesis enzyme MoaA
MAFRRWQRLVQKHRAFDWMGWVGAWPQRLLREWLKAPQDEIRKARFLGAVAGLVGELPRGELDATRANQDYRRVAAYVGEYSAGPRELVLYVTDRCNLRCVFGGNPCMRETSSGVPEHGEMTLDMVEHALDRWPSVRSCCICGFGEPLLYRPLDALIDALHRRGIVVGLITNGVLLDQRLEELEVRAPSYVSVSLNAADEAEHREITQTPTWERIVAGVERAVSRGHLRMGLSFVVSRRNVGRVKHYLAVAAELGVNFVNFHNVLPHDGPTVDFLDSVITERSEEALRVLEEARTLPGAHRVLHWPTILTAEPAHRCMSPLMMMGLDGGGLVNHCRRVAPPELANGPYTWADRWWAPARTRLLRAVTGDDPSTHEACRHCFGAWRE